MAQDPTEELTTLRLRIEQLEQELKTVKQKNLEMEGARVSAHTEDLNVPISEFEETLRRLVQRTAMIVQAEKCVIMVRDRETGELTARAPAWGMTDQEVDLFRIPFESAFSGDVFRNCEPAIFENFDGDTEAIKSLLEKLKVRNGVTVPLLIEKRDESNKLIESVTIGVLHCFNKRYDGEFIDEDVRLLERLSRNAAAVIGNAQMFQEVFEERQKLMHTLESLTAGLLFINQQGRIGQMNSHARLMFGVKEGQNPLGANLEEVIKDEKCLEILKRKMAEASEDYVAPVKEEGAEPDGPGEISMTDDDDLEYIYQLHAASVRDDNNKPIGTVVIFNDITDIRNVERMKTEFVSIVSHELRTPLTPMKGFVRTLLDDEKEEWYTLEDRREFHNIIDENVDRLSRLINDLLNVSRIEKMGAAGIEMNYEPDVDIRKAALEVIDIQKGRTDKHTLVIDFDPADIRIESDPDKIQNILQNFVSNAIKYAPNGGEVRIICRIEPPSEEFPLGSMMMGVKDHGTGIPEASLKKLGEKFFRLDNKDHRKAGGTGIGLFLVKNLIAAHGGYMWVESELGKGSTFWFRVPVKQPPTEGEQAPEMEA